MKLRYAGPFPAWKCESSEFRVLGFAVWQDQAAAILHCRLAWCLLFSAFACVVLFPAVHLEWHDLPLP